MFSASSCPPSFSVLRISCGSFSGSVQKIHIRFNTLNMTSSDLSGKGSPIPRPRKTPHGGSATASLLVVLRFLNTGRGNVHSEAASFRVLPAALDRGNPASAADIQNLIRLMDLKRRKRPIRKLCVTDIHPASSSLSCRTFWLSAGTGSNHPSFGSCISLSIFSFSLPASSSVYFPCLSIMFLYTISLFCFIFPVYQFCSSILPQFCFCSCLSILFLYSASLLFFFNLFLYSYSFALFFTQYSLMRRCNPCSQNISLISVLYY